MKRFEALLLFLLAGSLSFASCGSPPPVDRRAEAKPGEDRVASYPLELADQVAEWLRVAAVREGELVHWKPWAEADGRSEATLYSGTPGVVLFFLEHHAMTGRVDSRELAEAGLAWLMARAEKGSAGRGWNSGGAGPIDPGLYTGTAGVGATFLAAWEYLGDDRYRDQARSAADWLVAAAEKRDPGLAWNDSDDIISGAAGTGLFLLRAAELLDEERLLVVAAGVGDHLIDAALREGQGWKWRASEGSSRIYPNFSHGTSGVAYFLAVLHSATEEERYLDAALEGAKWLAAHAQRSGRGTAWFHHEPDGTELYYAGWCHGPGGTARLFRELYRATGEPRWLERESECAAWLIEAGLFERPLEGFWNVSACCGSAGIGDFFADLFRFTGDSLYREWADRLVEDLVQRSSLGEPGLMWVQAEHRVRPDLLQAQTGFAQGAAGIGLFLLKMHAVAVEGRGARPLVLPDSPY